MLRHFPLDFRSAIHAPPKDINGAAQGGNYQFICIKNFAALCVRIVVGAHTSTAVAVTLEQAKNVEGNSYKALEFTTYYSMAYQTSPIEHRDFLQEQTAASNTFNIAANTQFFIPIKPAMFDVSGGFDCARIVMSAPGASTVVFWEWLLWHGVNGIPSVIGQHQSVFVNKMNHAV